MFPIWFPQRAQLTKQLSLEVELENTYKKVTLNANSIG